MADGWGFHRDKQWRAGHTAGMWFSWGLMRSEEVEAALWAQFRVFRVPPAGRKVPSFPGAGLTPFLFHPSAPLSIESSLRDSE